ncbi:MAG: hypothetical protein UT66_C0034G0031 [candidate division CPR2 bacterium GW2011_GWC1_39_9]|uniref:Uncharacterized protein n=1 Tax=candidate division CPR2 bacterium GW2011_GWC2_39_10 TaxID=1618345 RepID=A0A0G0LUE4_UNCC2|nr:MAG: hypothetical protein UT18_C0009G0038 [candidate division CPR2 bacterium GW2011_GWC2_39_10]KKR33772.1 MAG: hypothetical protein UT66_C0034G0031 [candidate division CPR2 bacterium GW2011_GWC1_39_9]
MGDLSVAILICLIIVILIYSIPYRIVGDVIGFIPRHAISNYPEIAKKYFGSEIANLTSMIAISGGIFRYKTKIKQIKSFLNDTDCSQDPRLVKLVKRLNIFLVMRKIYFGLLIMLTIYFFIFLYLTSMR